MVGAKQFPPDDVVIVNMRVPVQAVPIWQKPLRRNLRRQRNKRRSEESLFFRRHIASRTACTSAVVERVNKDDAP